MVFGKLFERLEPRASQNRLSAIFIFGDSIATGFQEAAGGWAGRLKRFASQIGIPVYNFAVNGSTSRDVLSQLQRYALQIKSGSLIILQVGINDVAMRGGTLTTSPGLFRSNVATLIRAAKQRGSVMFVGINHVNEKEVNSYEARYGNKLVFMNSNIDAYNSIVESECNLNGVRFIRTADAVRDELADGLHPNPRGHEIIFNLLRNKLGW